MHRQHVHLAVGTKLVLGLTNALTLPKLRRKLTVPLETLEERQAANQQRATQPQGQNTRLYWQA
jgi:hypothetical protein